MTKTRDHEQIDRDELAEQRRERDRQREPSTRRRPLLASWEGLPSIAGHTVKLQLSNELTIRYRWRCSCGTAGEPRGRIGSARAGAIAHVTTTAARSGVPL